MEQEADTGNEWPPCGMVVEHVNINSFLEQIFESGQPVAAQGEIQVVGMEEGCAVIKIGSGTYEFTAESRIQSSKSKS